MREFLKGLVSAPHFCAEWPSGGWGLSPSAPPKTEGRVVFFQTLCPGRMTRQAPNFEPISVPEVRPSLWEIKVSGPREKGRERRRDCVPKSQGTHVSIYVCLLGE